MSVHSVKEKSKPYFFILLFLLVIGGCAPVGPPPPPGFFFMGFNWLVIAVVIAGAFLLWNHINSPKEKNTDHITDAINAINERLNRLEKRLEHMEKDSTGD